MAKKVRIGVVDQASKVRSSIGAWVIWGHNYLHQRRQFAYDGRYWFYQPTIRSAFQEIGAEWIPPAVVEAMAHHIGLAVGALVTNADMV